MRNEFSQLHLKGGEAREFAHQTLLLWMAFARLHCAAGSNPSTLLGLATTEGLAESPFWAKLHRDAALVLRNECLSMAFGKEYLPDFAAFLVRMTQLINSIGLNWTHVDTIANELSTGTSRYNPDAIIEQEVIVALFDALNATQGSHVWLPFDRNGQLLSEAIRRHLIPVGEARQSQLGFMNVFNPGSSRSVVMLALMGEESALLCDTGLLGAQSHFWSNEKPELAIITTPSNFSLEQYPSSSFERQNWAENASDSSCHLRSINAKKGDAASLTLLLPHVERKAVVLASPKLLFSKGQEYRFRNVVIGQEMSLTDVVQLPKGTYVQSNFAGALLVFDKSALDKTVRFTNCSGASEKNTFNKLSRILAHEHVLKNNAVEKRSEGQDNAVICKVVSYQEILKNDFTWLPSRYIATSGDSDIERIELEQLVEIIRPAPILKQSPSAVDSCEIGIPQLGTYLPIVSPSEKLGLIEKNKIEQYKLIKNDVVLSTKGTIGKVGLIGLEPLSGDAIPVSSNSCVALRIRPGVPMTAEALMMYFCSDDGKKQLKMLSVGATVAALPLESVKKIAIPKDCLVGGMRAESYLRAFNELKVLSTERLKIENQIAEVEKTTFRL